MTDLFGITIGSITIGGIIYLGKVIINKGFDAALKNYESKLELLKIEYQIKLSALHAERANLLKKMYHKLYKLMQALKELTTSFQGEEWLDPERTKTATNILLDCIKLFEANRIFFPNEFCKKLEDSLEQSRSAIEDWRKTVTKGKREEHNAKWGIANPYKDGDTSMDWWLKTERKVLYDLEENRKNLADDFRKLIGVEMN